MEPVSQAIGQKRAHPDDAAEEEAANALDMLAQENISPQAAPAVKKIKTVRGITLADLVAYQCIEANDRLTCTLKVPLDRESLNVGEKTWEGRVNAFGEIVYGDRLFPTPSHFSNFIRGLASAELDSHDRKADFVAQRILLPADKVRTNGWTALIHAPSGQSLNRIRQSFWSSISDD